MHVVITTDKHVVHDDDDVRDTRQAIVGNGSLAETKDTTAQLDVRMTIA